MASVTISDSQGARPKQNWIVGPVGDFSFIIAAPLLALVWSVTTFQVMGPTRGAEVVFAIFLAFNVAHHFPTFVRIYGDVDLLRRFFWSLVLGPLIPFSTAMALVTYLILNGQPVESFIFLGLILLLWDPWHFLMQHYGFMRIYDRHNAAPPKLAAWMDYSLCAAWFIYIMIAASGWLPNLLYQMEHDHGLPLLQFFANGGYGILKSVAFVVAGVATCVYMGYLLWCWRRGFFVSYAKLLLALITFGIMYLTYTPNPVISRYLPGWSFSLGFATIGMVHVTQYMAIVWKYNRGLAERPKRARPGWFSMLFSHGGYLVAGLYVGACLLYGMTLTSQWFRPYIVSASESMLDESGKWVLGTMLAISFTSTFLHYYFDGFIWKMRHKENRENLAIQGDSSEQSRTSSWWERFEGNSMLKTLAFQSLYFLPPLLFIIGTYAFAQQDSNPQPIAQYFKARTMREQFERLVLQGSADDHRNALRSVTEERGTAAPLSEVSARDVEPLVTRIAYHRPNPQTIDLPALSELYVDIYGTAQSAVEGMTRQIALQEKMVQIQPKAQHYTYLADLVYCRAEAKHHLLRTTSDQQSTGEFLAAIKTAIAAAEKALTYPAPYSHQERPDLTEDKLRQQIQTWKRTADRLRREKPLS